MIRKVFTIATAIIATLSVARFECQAQAYSGGRHARALVVQPIDETKLITLAGNTRPEATAENDRGAVPDSQPMEHMQLVLQRPPELEKQLQTLIEDQQRKDSPQYHKWLTAKEFGARFGPSPEDIQKVSNWLQNHGFRVDSVFTSGMAIEFSGTVGQIKDTFHTEIHNLDVKGEPHFANISEPRIPSALAGVVYGVNALDNFMPHPLMKKRPQFTFPTSSYGTFYAIVPQDLATIYNLNPAFTAETKGANQTIVVIEDTNMLSADVSTFRTAFGLSGNAGTFSQVNPPKPASGGATCTNPNRNGDEIEAALDAEWAGAAAPDAAIELASCASSGSTFGGLIALENIINAAGPYPQVVSISYGECEPSNGAARNAAYSTTYQQAATQGMSIFVSSGDEGAASCDANRTSATHGISVSGFTSTPYNVSVGGTDFADTYESLLPSGLPVSTYWNTSNTAAFGSAKSYMPEIPWNDSCAQAILYELEGFTHADGPSGFCNTSTAKNDGFLTTASGSGGPSNCATGSPANAGVANGTCAGWAKPAWQSVPGNPADGVRDIPDVSLMAANGLWGHFYMECMSDAPEGGVACVYTDPTGTDMLNQAYGGTSISSPIMAGIQALVNQAAGGAGAGNPNPRYYQLASLEYGTPSGEAACNSSLGTGIGSTCVFNDITVGDIDVNCKDLYSGSTLVGTFNCFDDGGTKAAPIYGILSTSTPPAASSPKTGPDTVSGTAHPAYPTSAGWDFATGIGSVNAYNLIQNWTAIQTTTVVNSSANPSTWGESVTFTATVTPNIGNTETGTITWSSNTGCAPSTISGGVATCTPSAPGLNVGNSQTVTATYSGDSTYAGSSGSVSQTVNLAPLTVTCGAASFTYGGPLPLFPVTVTGIVGPDSVRGRAEVHPDIPTGIGAVCGLNTTLYPTLSVHSPAGFYPNGITVTSLTGAALVNYQVTQNTGNLTISPATLKVAAFNVSRTYGAAPPASFAAAITGFVNGDNAGTAYSGKPSVTTTANTSAPYSPVGAYPITPSNGTLSSNNYTFNFVPGTLTITKAALAVTAHGYSRVYGAALPSPYAYAVTGFVNGDNAGTAYTGTPSITSAAVQGSVPGSYTITAAAGSLSSNNYSFTFHNGTLTITDAVLTVTAQPTASVAYGSAPPASFTHTVTGYLSGDNAANSITGTPTVTTSANSSAPYSPAGNYPITAAIGTLASSKYTFQFVPGTLTITKVSLKFTPFNYTRNYGAAIPAFGFAVTGYVNGDNAAAAYSGKPSFTTTAVKGSPAGNYPITGATGTLASNNYTFNFGSGILTIDKVSLKFTPFNYSSIYDAAIPAFGFAVTGYVNGDDAASAYSGNPSFTTTAVKGSVPNTYPITGAAGTLASDKYTFQFGSGTLTITPAMLMITAFNVTRAHNQALPASYSYSVAGYVNGDNAGTAFTGTPSVTCPAVQGSPAGPYTITTANGTLSSPKYTFIFHNGTLTITP